MIYIHYYQLLLFRDQDIHFHASLMQINRDKKELITKGKIWNSLKMPCKIYLAKLSTQRISPSRYIFLSCQKTNYAQRLWHRCFPVNFANFLKNNFFTEHLLETSSELTSTYQVFYSNFDNAIFIISEV